jgi:hypothetical protein
MNMISLVEAASADKSLCIHDEDQKECRDFDLIFCYLPNILHKSNALKGKKPKFATTKIKI